MRAAWRSAPQFSAVLTARGSEQPPVSADGLHSNEGSADSSTLQSLTGAALALGPEHVQRGDTYVPTRRFPIALSARVSSSVIRSR